MKHLRRPSPMELPSASGKVESTKIAMTYRVFNEQTMSSKYFYFLRLGTVGSVVKVLFLVTGRLGILVPIIPSLGDEEIGIKEEMKTPQFRSQEVAASILLQVSTELPNTFTPDLMPLTLMVIFSHGNVL